MANDVMGIYSSLEQLLTDINVRIIDKNNDVQFFTVDSDQYHTLKEKTSIKGSLLETPERNGDGGIHSLATAFDEDDGSLELMRIEKVLLEQGFSQEDAAECKIYLHKGMIVVTEKV
jgi:hypothetical protein